MLRCILSNCSTTCGKGYNRNTYYRGLIKRLVSALYTPIHDMDQNTSTIAKLRAEQVDQISDNLSRSLYQLAPLDASADADSSSPSPLPQQLQWAVERLKELFNELEPEQLLVVLPEIRKLMDLGRYNQSNGLGLGLREFDEFGQLLGRLMTVKERRSKIPVVRYLPCISDFPPSELNGPASSEWLAMFVHSDVPSVCIEDYNACCNICLEDFEEPALALELLQVDGDDVDLMAKDDRTQASPKPLRQLICGHVLHVRRLPAMFQGDNYDEMFECPVCRAEVWTSLPDPQQFSLLPPKIPLEIARSSVSSDQRQTYDDYYNSLRPWQKIHENLLNWATSTLRMSDFDQALNSTTHGHPVNEIALFIWIMQTYRRYVYSRMTDSSDHEGLVDCLVLDHVEAWSIGSFISEGEHRAASRGLREFWDVSGLQDAPRLLAVLAEHSRPDGSCHWVVHRFSLPDGALTTYHFYPELPACPDCRPASWWPAIHLAWPDAVICPDPSMPTLIHLHRPVQLAEVDNFVAAVGIWYNILMGLPAECVDLERVRDVIGTEVESLRERYNSWASYLSTFFGDLYRRCERVEGDRVDL
ncbi:hypothetical protein D9758_013578 [Tetrapyrgos nigripes]|uniref:RING-type domain-containing protein n=1 Tax=Tetrapyrgos nigripes TaxID=182062 RepID=A0A8H5FKT0_9AGAR|nr:hypothetical protein D9758_013578 [Tetrapyrgos nigripes]